MTNDDATAHTKSKYAIPQSHDFTTPESKWVKCPVCGESDMQQTADAEGNKLIFCVNHACASNGGTNASALPQQADGQRGDGALELLVRAIKTASPPEVGARILEAYARELPAALNAAPSAGDALRDAAANAFAFLKGYDMQGMTEGEVIAQLRAALPESTKSKYAIPQGHDFTT